MTKRPNKKTIITFAATAFLCLGQVAVAEPPSPAAQVGNFTLTDQTGKSHELYTYTDAPVIVIATQVNGDAISRESARELETLQGMFGKAEYFMLNSSQTDTPATIAAETQAIGTTIPVLDDEHQAVGQALGVTQTGEAFVIDPIGWKILYRGPVSAVAAKDSSEPFLLFNAIVYAMSHRAIDQSVVEVKGTPIAIAAH